MLELHHWVKEKDPSQQKQGATQQKPSRGVSQCPDVDPEAHFGVVFVRSQQVGVKVQ